MAASWSEQLIAQTRDILDLGFVPADGFVHMKNCNGSFGTISLQHWLAKKYVIVDQLTGAEFDYATVDELIAAGWAVD